MDFLGDKALNWLLEPDEPAVRAQALVGLCGADPSSPEVVQARRRAMEEGPTAAILDQQEDHGGWEPDRDYYSRGTLATMPVLAQLGADPSDERIGRACARALSLIPEHGHFLTGCGQPANLWALARFGWTDDPRFIRACHYTMARYRLEDGSRVGRLRWQRGTCFGKHPCFMAVVKMVWLLSVLRGNPAFPWAETLLAASVEFLLHHHVYLSSRKLKPVRREWADFACPVLCCDTDALDLLAAVCHAGACDDPRVIPAVQLVLSKRDNNGRWSLDHSYSPSDGGTAMRAKTVGNVKMAIRADVGRLGRPSKWVTLKAMTALSSAPDEFADAKVDLQPDRAPRRLSSTAPARSPVAEQMLRDHFLSIGAEPFLEATFRAGGDLGLRPYWDGTEKMLFLGPDWMPEWMAVRPVIVGGSWAKARQTRSGWLWRVLFMARKGALAEEEIIDILRVPRDPPKGKKRRVRFGRWEKEFEEISVDLYSLEEVRNLEELLRRGLGTLSPDDAA